MFPFFASLLLAAAETTTGTDDVLRSVVMYAIVAAVLILPFVVGGMLAKMLRMPDYGTKIGMLIVSVLVSGLVLYFRWPPPLGVDLKGGVILVYQVDEAQTKQNAGDPTNAAQSSAVDLNALCQALKLRVNPNGLKEIVIRPFGENQVEVIVPENDRAEIDRIKDLISKPGFLEFLIVANNEQKDSEVIAAAREQSQNPDLQRERRVFDKPGGTQIGYWARVARDPEENKDNERKLKVEGAVFDFVRDGITGTILDPRQLQALANGKNSELEKYLREQNIELEVLMRVDADYLVRGDHLSSASTHFGTSGPEVHFTFNDQGSGLMATLTGTNLPNPERKLGIVLDGDLISAPVIRGRISDQGQITGNFTEDEVNFIVEILRAGQLPAVLNKEPISENVIGSMLGQDTIQKGTVATWSSFALVVLFMLIYYRFAGLVADFALLLNLALTLAIMMLINAPLTLPGLAGLVLTCGMAVDANVLIFERIREELQKGAGLRMALRNGFDRAMVTIIDSNLTTILTAVVLYLIGTDQVKGFSITLVLGIGISMFTACYITRIIFDIAERQRWITSLSMMKLMTTTNIKFTNYFAPAMIASGIFIAIGVAAVVARGRTLFDIDLAGGTSVTAVFKEAVSPDLLRKTLDEALKNERDRHDASVTYSLNSVAVNTIKQPNRVYRVDSSWKDGEDEKKLQDLMKKLFMDENAVARLQAYNLTIESVKTATTTKEVTPVNPAPPAETPPKTESPKKEEPKAEEPKSEETPKKEADDSKKEEEPKKSACADEDEKKSEDEKKTEDKPAEDKPVADQPAESKPAEDKPAGDKPADSKPAAEAPGIPGDLAKPNPNLITAVTSTAVLKFTEGEMSGQSLRAHLEETAKKLYGEQPYIELETPDVNGKKWDGKGTDPYADWTVKISMNEEKTQKVLEAMRDRLQGTPVFQSINKIGVQVAGDTQQRAIFAVFFSLIGIALYIWIRFHKLSWGLAAVAALLHDALVMLGCIAASYWLADALGIIGIEEFKISLTVIAAFLTLIGFSINDTIVIFDRIREVRGKNPDLTAGMIDDSVNQTLSRTILTSGTVFIVLIVLYGGGGPGIHAFAFSMLVGVISGTYSTVFIASPMLLWLLGKDKNGKSLLSV